MPRRSRDAAINAYILGVWVAVGVLGVIAWRLVGLGAFGTVALLAALATASSWVGFHIERGVQFSAGHIAVLAAIAMAPPLGAAVVGLFMGLAADRRVPVRNRVFNGGMWALVPIIAALGYGLIGGSHHLDEIDGLSGLIFHVGAPLLLVDILQTVLNAYLLAGVIRLSNDTPVLTVMRGLLLGSGVTTMGYGLIAFLLVVLWQPGGLGPSSVILILMPLLGARWAYRQYGEERAARERTLRVLVAAVETKAPHLAGHSDRVAALSARMAEGLGLGPVDVRDIEVAGMLHDLGQVALPRPVIRAGDLNDPLFRSYGRRGANLLRGVSFLAGSLDGIAHHAEPGARPWSTEPGHGAGQLASHIVHVADTYDLLTEVADHGAPPIPPQEALARLRLELPAADAELVDVLSRALARTPPSGAGE